MPTVRVGEFEGSFVIYFGSEFSRINAYTLASTLVGFADAARAANATLNPGYELQVVVESLGPGSFKATVRTLYISARNLFSRDPLRSVVLGVIASYVYQQTLSPDTEVVVNVGETEVVIEQGDTRIFVPRDVHRAVEQVERSPQFCKGIADAIRAVETDESVATLGFASEAERGPPPLQIPRERFAAISSSSPPTADDIRELVEVTDLQIIRAILEKSRRRWEFIWNGVRISAPVLDERFHADFSQHRITIAPGDVLRARLRVRQRFRSDLGAFVNESYEVIEVLSHVPRARQRMLPLRPKGGRGKGARRTDSREPRLF